MKTHRSPVYARNGVVAASQPLAVSAGLEILRRGGSAIDAAIATSAVLAIAASIAEPPRLNISNPADTASG